MNRIVMLIFLLSSSLYGGGLYTYVDESGARVLTNLGNERRSTRGPESNEPEEGNFAGLIQQYSSHYGIDQDLVTAIIEVESNFDPKAVSSKNCKGLMQLHPDTARRFGVADIFDPAENIQGGVRYLDFLMNQFDRKLDLVLAAYNAGENAVRRHNGIPPYSETVDYVQKVKTIFGKDLEASKTIQRKARIYRFVSDEGHVILTNVPTQ